MQPITPELETLLKSKLQAGPSGWWGKVEVTDAYPPDWTQLDGVRRISIDKSFQAQADQLQVTVDNKDGSLSFLSGGPLQPELVRIRVTQGYGDDANGLVTFSGFIDDVQEHREDHYVTVTARDWMKHLLVQDIAIESPQGADEEGADRTEDNGVFLNREASYIVDAILDKALWPDATRDVRQTSYVFDEFLLQDGESYADALGRIADATGYEIWATEDEVFHFAPAMRSNRETTDDTDVALWTFRGTEDIYVIDPRKDGYDLKTRVRAVGQITSNTIDSTLEQQWVTSVLSVPRGIGLDPADPTKLRILDAIVRKVYRVNQSTFAVEASTSVLGRSGVYCIGLSFDPDDSAVFWILDDPFYSGGTGAAKVYKYRRSDDALLDSFFVTSGHHYYDMKVSNTHVWLARRGVSSGTVEKWTKAGAFVAAYTPAVPGDPGSAPTAIGIDYASGDDLYFATGHAQVIRADHATPESTSLWAVGPGTFLAFEIDPTTNDTVYGATGSNLTGKYLKVDTSSTDQTRLSVEAFDDALERALGSLAGVERQIRRFTITDPNITNRAQATETANRWLTKLKQYRQVVQWGAIANPGTQKGDMVHVDDPPTGMDHDVMVDSVRLEMDPSSGTFLMVIASTDWNPVYGTGGSAPGTGGNRHRYYTLDDFNRAQSGLGTSSSGEDWTLLSSIAQDVNGTEAAFTNFGETISEYRLPFFADGNIDLLIAFRFGSVPGGFGTRSMALFLVDDTNIQATWQFGADAGVGSVLAAGESSDEAAFTWTTDPYYARCQFKPGQTVRTKVWKQSDREPSHWTAESDGASQTAPLYLDLEGVLGGDWSFYIDRIEAKV